MSVVRVTASRWENYWVLDIEGFGVTQSHSLASAEAMVRDYIIDDVENVANVEIEFTYDLPEAQDAAAVRADLAGINDALNKAAARSRRVARKLKERGITGADAAAVMGVSPQRVSQLLKSKK